MKEAFIIIVIHYIADFVFQDEKWAVGKSKSLDCLFMHTVTYSLVWVAFSLIWMLFDFQNARNIASGILYFAPITFVCHTITDYFTSKVTSGLYAKGKFGSSIPNLGFFSMIGFDQVLHYAQLFLTYWYLTK
jgi:hypothetical protein